MSTPYTTIYDSFLSRLNDNEFAKESAEYIVEDDLKAILKIAINKFKFPKSNLRDRNDSAAEFTDVLGEKEVEVLACYMKAEWAKRCVTNWRLIYPQYQAKDFQPAGSPANHLDKLQTYAKDTVREARKAESEFHRTPEDRPYNYKKLAGSNNE